jgi:hypothetical protein
MLPWLSVHCAAVFLRVGASKSLECQPDVLESNEHGIARVSHYTISFAICLLLTELQI